MKTKRSSQRAKKPAKKTSHAKPRKAAKDPIRSVKQVVAAGLSKARAAGLPIPERASNHR